MENSTWKWQAKWGMAGWMLCGHQEGWGRGGRAGGEYDKLQSGKHLIWHSLVYVVFLVKTIAPSVRPRTMPFPAFPHNSTSRKCGRTGNNVTSHKQKVTEMAFISCAHSELTP